MLRFATSCRHFLVVFAICFLPSTVMAQFPEGSSASLTVYVQGPDGAPVDELAIVELTNLTGRFRQQSTTRSGTAEFTGLPGDSYNLSVVAVGFQRATEQFQLGDGGPNLITVRLQLESQGHPAAFSAGPPVLAPHAKKELGQALEAMRSGKLPEAQTHLAVAYRLAPADPEVNYVFGLYYAQANDWSNAKSYWEKVLSLYPKHFGALLSMGTVLLRENQPVDAETFLKRALDAEPSSWRAHALLAEAYLREGFLDDSIQEAQRAVELGHGRAAAVEPLLARAFAKRGDTAQAIQILTNYLKENPLDARARQQLDGLQARVPGDAPAVTADPPPDPSVSAVSTLLVPPSTWLPPDVDETVPPVEPGVACDLKAVLHSAGKRVEEFVRDVDRFTATESITYQSINKWGLPSPTETFQFDYLVSIQQSGTRLLNVEEYRPPRSHAPTHYPDGVKPSGLPALMLIFHPYYSDNFEMTCEGLAHRNSGLAWQVHFRQKTNSPNTIRVYRLSQNGPSHSAALKGRAWIAADSFQIVRLETDLVAPLPQIRLLADHAAVEYGPVKFRAANADMWLPQTAEFYYDWLGRRGHRVQRFTNYMLFSVSDKQHLSTPKAQNTDASDNPASDTVPNR